MVTRTRALQEAGQSLWLDNIQRRELHNGSLQKMIDQDGICGVTSNPTIFMNAVTKSRDYDGQIAELFRQGKSSLDIYHAITIDDIRSAAELFLPVFEATDHTDGFVSIELNPQHAFRIEQSVKEAQQIVAEIGLPNIMVKVPGTAEGITVVGRLVAEGLNVNITLLFSPDRYRQVAETYLDAIEQRAGMGKDISDIHSVASFFISRIDTKVDRCVDDIAARDPSARDSVAALRGQSAVQVAKVTYGLFKELFLSSRFQLLQEKGARIQRVLWASTGTKDPSYSDVKYVESLIGPQTVNTLPPKTIDAFRDHGVVGNTLQEGLESAPALLEQFGKYGIDLNMIFDQLQQEGVKAFEISYLDLLRAIEEKGSALLNAG